MTQVAIFYSTKKITISEFFEYLILANIIGQIEC